jgi:hypothetical protein
MTRSRVSDSQPKERQPKAILRYMLDPTTFSDRAIRHTLKLCRQEPLHYQDSRFLAFLSPLPLPLATVPL